jgi:hypothetical protein
MTNYWNRFCGGKLSAADIDRIHLFLLSIFVAGGILCVLLIDAEQKEYALEGLLPVFLVLVPLCVGIQWWLYDHATLNVRTAPSNLVHLFSTLFFAGAISMFGLGYVELINAATGSSHPVIIQGPVVKLEWLPAGRYHGSAHHVTVYFDGRNVTFSESKSVYLDLKLGEVFRTEALMGGLGRYWRPEHSFGK